MPASASPHSTRYSPHTISSLCPFVPSRGRCRSSLSIIWGRKQIAKTVRWQHQPFQHSLATVANAAIPLFFLNESGMHQHVFASTSLHASFPFSLIRWNGTHTAGASISSPRLRPYAAWGLTFLEEGGGGQGT